MKSFEEVVAAFNLPEYYTDIRYYLVTLPADKNPESIDITWYFDSDVSCTKLDDGNYYAYSKGQGDPQHTQEILPQS